MPKLRARLGYIWTILIRKGAPESRCRAGLASGALGRSGCLWLETALTYLKQTPGMDLVSTGLGPMVRLGRTEQISEEALKRELFDLRQSLAPFRASHDSVGGTPEAHGPSPEGLDTEVGEQPTTPAPERTPERRASPDNGQSELDTPFAKGPEYPVAESGLAGIGSSSTLGEHAGPDGLPEAASASGTVAAPSVTDSRRLSLVFIPCPDSEQLGTLWEALDRITGTGGIVDARPLGGDGGFEFI